MIRSLDGIAPKIHPTAFISESAYVVGDVTIGEGSSIWPGVVVRADAGKITIGRFTCIQDNSVVHGDADVVIGDRVVMGHMVLCHARSVGDRVLIGSGATVNDGVEIGEDSLIASTAMVLENMVIPSRSLVVGVPGRVKWSGRGAPHRADQIDLRSLSAQGPALQEAGRPGVGAGDLAGLHLLRRVHRHQAQAAGQHEQSRLHELEPRLGNIRVLAGAGHDPASLVEPVECGGQLDGVVGEMVRLQGCAPSSRPAPGGPAFFV